MSAFPENPFWQFSLQVYAAPGVAEACLALQDRHALDVNLLLFACWAGASGHSLDRSAFRRLRAASEPWQREIVAPLRRARRALKPYPGAEEAALRKSLQEFELQAERLEQDRLHAALTLHQEDPGGTPGDRTSPALVAANLLGYLESRAVRPDDSDRARLAALIAGCAPPLTPQAAEALLANELGGGSFGER